MSLAWLSLGALFVAIVISCTTRLNVGVISIAMAWVIGVYIGGFKVDEIAAGFPGQLFLTLTGVTLLFTQAQLNGTLDKIAHRAVFLCRGNTGLIPVMFFVLAAGLASIGPGNIATAALMAPMAMAVAGRAGVPAFLMAIMVGNGANAGSLSPFAPTGIIVNGLLHKIGMPGLAWESYWTNLAAHALVAFSGYALFGGWRLFRIRYEHTAEAAVAADARGGSAASPNIEARIESYHFDRKNWVTVAAIFALITGVIVFRIQVGMGAFAAAVLLALAGAAEHVDSLKKVPWNAIVMVCGVTVLIALLERTQGIALFTDLLARIATQRSVTAVIAFLTGLISVYSSTSGVVLPAFLPTVPGLAARIGGDATAIALSMNVGGHLVDVSPLSTIGALCIAAAPAGVDTKVLFNQLLAWGLSMTVAGALVCWLFFGKL